MRTFWKKSRWRPAVPPPRSRKRLPLDVPRGCAGFDWKSPAERPTPLGPRPESAPFSGRPHSHTSRENHRHHGRLLKIRTRRSLDSPKKRGPQGGSGKVRAAFWAFPWGFSSTPPPEPNSEMSGRLQGAGADSSREFTQSRRPDKRDVHPPASGPWRPAPGMNQQPLGPGTVPDAAGRSRVIREDFADDAVCGQPRAEVGSERRLSPGDVRRRVGCPRPVRAFWAKVPRGDSTSGKSTAKGVFPGGLSVEVGCRIASVLSFFPNRRTGELRNGHGDAQGRK